MPEPRPKQKHRRPEPKKYTQDLPLVFFTRIFSGTMRLFLDCTKGSPLRLFRYFAAQ